MMTSIGESLATARRERQLTVKDVEKAIKIRAKHIDALEKEAFDQISGDAYVQGFIRTYAQWLELDPEPLIQEYKQTSTDTVSNRSVESLEPPFRNGRLIRGALLTLAAGGLLFILIRLALPLLSGN